MHQLQKHVRMLSILLWLIHDILYTSLYKHIKNGTEISLERLFDWVKQFSQHSDTFKSNRLFKVFGHFKRVGSVFFFFLLVKSQMKWTFDFGNNFTRVLSTWKTYTIRTLTYREWHSIVWKRENRTGMMNNYY